MLFPPQLSRSSTKLNYKSLPHRAYLALDNNLQCHNYTQCLSYVNSFHVMCAQTSSCSLSLSLVQIIPTNFSKVIANPKWKTTMVEEYNALVSIDHGILSLLA